MKDTGNSLPSPKVYNSAPCTDSLRTYTHTNTRALEYALAPVLRMKSKRYYNSRSYRCNTMQYFLSHVYGDMQVSPILYDVGGDAYANNTDDDEGDDVHGCVFYREIDERETRDKRNCRVRSNRTA